MLAQMAAVVLSAESIDMTIALVTTLGAEAIPDTTVARGELVDAPGKRSTAASDPLVDRADALQYQFDSGPCLTACATRRPFASMTPKRNAWSRSHLKSMREAAISDDVPLEAIDPLTAIQILVNRLRDPDDDYLEIRTMTKYGDNGPLTGRGRRVRT